MRTHVIAALGCALLATGGCAQLRPNPSHQIESSEQVSWIDEHSSYPAVRRVYFEQLNLIELIDPRGDAKRVYEDAWAASDKYDKEDARYWGVKYDLAFATFRESSATPERKREHRNGVQDRILGVSTSRCNVFKTYLRRQQTEWNFLLGSATTAAGVLGAVFSGVNASRNLAGAAGLFSGLQAEYNQQYFSNLTAHLIIQGIELRQTRLLATIVKERQSLSVADYSMEAAVKDAILFDGSCSTVTGLSEASESIKEVTNPGIPRAFEIMAGVRAMNEMANAPNFVELAESGKLQKLLKQATPATAPLVAAVAKPVQPVPIPERLVAASRAQARIAELIAAKAEGVTKAFTDAQAKLEKDKQSASPKPGAITDRFAEKAKEALKQLPVDKCVGALLAPAEAVGKASAIVALKAEGSPDRLLANEELEKAKAQAGLAVGRVELLVNTATAAVQSMADAWSAQVRLQGFDDNKLQALDGIAPGADLTKLCG
jgi:hypothetical protein